MSDGYTLINATDIRRYAADALNRVEGEGERFAVVRHGKTVALLIPAAGSDAPKRYKGPKKYPAVWGVGKKLSRTKMPPEEPPEIAAPFSVPSYKLPGSER